MKLAYLLQRRTDLPQGQEWLSADEAAILDRFRYPKRREDWLLGRWTAKSALARCASLPGDSIKDWQVGTRPDGSPEASYHGNASGVPLSLSHRSGLCFCVLAEEGAEVGCDLEQVEARSSAFVETWFTEREIDWLAQSPTDQRDLLVTLIWSAKESALKALRLGLRADTRRVQVESTQPGASSDWLALMAEDTAERRRFHGWWRRQDDMICTVLADRKTDAPLPL